MTHLHCITSPSLPRWDGSCVLFEVTDGGGQIPCAISRAALEDLGETRCFKAAEWLGRFASARRRIEELALEKLRARPVGVSGRLNLWADDVDLLPAGGASAAACHGAPSHQGA